MRDSLNYYGSYLNHLLAASHTPMGDRWPLVEREIELRNEEITLIHTTSPGAVAVVVDTYIYLRDGHEASWHSPKLAQRELDHVRESFVTAVGSTGSTVLKVNLRTHCRGVHYHCGQHSPCFYKGLSPEEAQQQMAYDLEEVTKPGRRKAGKARRGKKKKKADDGDASSDSEG